MGSLGGVGGAEKRRRSRGDTRSGQQVECAWGGKGQISPRSPKSGFLPQKGESHRCRWGVPEGHIPHVAKILRDGKVPAAPAFPCREAVTPSFPTVSRSVSKYPLEVWMAGGRADLHQRGSPSHHPWLPPGLCSPGPAFLTVSCPVTKSTSLLGIDPVATPSGDLPFPGILLCGSH